MAEPDNDFFAGDTFADVGFGFVGVAVAFLDVVGDFVCTAVFRAFKRADGAGDAGIHVRPRTGNHAGGEGGGVELVFGIQNQRNVHGFNLRFGRTFAVQQVQEVAADGVFFAFDVDAFAVVRILIPVEQDAAKAGDEFVRNVARFAVGVAFAFGMNTAEHGHAGTHDVHRMRVRRQAFQHFNHADRQAAHGFELGFVGGEFKFVGQVAVNQQVGDFFKLAFLRQIKDVVTAVAQIVAGAADGTQRGIARRHAGEGNGFFRFEGRGFGGCSHGISPLCFYGVWVFRRPIEG